jgi:hypothetical protein
MFEKGATVPLLGWSVVECGMYLAAACLPLLRPVVEKVTPQKWKVKFGIYGISRHNRTECSMDHSFKKRALSSNVTKLGVYDENSGSLEMGHTATFVNEVNGPSVSEACLVHPEGIKVTNEISVSVTHSPGSSHDLSQNASYTMEHSADTTSSDSGSDGYKQIN